MEEYIGYLKAEMRALSPYLEGGTIKSVYFGGGTPTMLPVRYLGEIIDEMSEGLGFRKGAMFTVEADPFSLSSSDAKDKLSSLKEMGANRISMGVQTFRNDVLGSIRREQGPSSVVTAFRNMRKQGFSNINLDMMHCLPGQGVSGWESDLLMASGMNPDSISSYQLRLSTPGMDRIYARNRQLFPSLKESILMRIVAREFLQEMGYDEVSTNYFYKSASDQPKKGSQTIGIGLASRSEINGIIYKNFPEKEQYYKSLSKGRVPLYFALPLSREQMMEKYIVRGLNSREGIDRKVFTRTFGTDISDAFSLKIRILGSLGMIEEDSRVIKPSYKGMVFGLEVSRFMHSPGVYEKTAGLFLRNQHVKKNYIRVMKRIKRSKLHGPALSVIKWLPYKMPSI